MEKLIITAFARREDFLKALPELKTLRKAEFFLPHSEPTEKSGISTVQVLAFLGGIVGISAGFGFQYWTSSIDYPMNLGGKPFFEFLPSVVVAFEAGILFASIGAFIGFLVASELHTRRDIPEYVGNNRDKFIAVIPDKSLNNKNIREIIPSDTAFEIIESEVRS